VFIGQKTKGNPGIGCRSKHSVSRTEPVIIQGVFRLRTEKSMSSAIKVATIPMVKPTRQSSWTLSAWSDSSPRFESGKLERSASFIVRCQKTFNSCDRLQRRVKDNV